MDEKTNLDRSNSLVELAARIKVEHEAAAGALKRGAEHAMNAGDLLIEAKAKVKRGQWLAWLADHCEISERTAQLYMRMAKARPDVEANTQHVADLTLRGAMAVIAPDEGEAILKRIREADQEIADAVRERMEGLRAFAAEVYSLSPSDRDAFLATLSPSDRKLIPRWRKITDEVIADAQWRISCALA